MRFVQASRAAGSSVWTRRISPILMSAFQSARPAYTGSSNSAACPCTRDVVEHPLEHRDRARVVGIAGQHQPQMLERRFPIVLAIVLDLRHPEADADQIALGQHAPLQQILEQARQIAPALGLRVQAVERLGGLPVVGRNLQHALERGDGFFQPLQR